jgi:hypothetical protein
MNVLITLTTAGADTGPFNLYSNVDNYTTAFETNISKGILVAGYTSTIVPPGTTAVRVWSMGICANYVDIILTVPATTTTTTTSAPVGTTTTTTTAAPVATTSTTTTYVGPATTTTTTTYVGPATTTTTTTAPSTTTTTTTSGGGGTTTTTTTAPTTSTTTTSIFVSCEEWRNDTLEEATITYTPCGSGTPVSGYALASTSSVCAVYGSITVTVGGPLTLVGACSAPSTTTTTTTAIPGTTTTTTTALVYYAFSLTAGGIDSATACADSSAAITLYGSNISFLSNATFYNDYTLLSPYDGSNLYYKNVANNEYVQISSIGSQTAAGSC